MAGPSARTAARAAVAAAYSAAAMRLLNAFARLRCCAAVVLTSTTLTTSLARTAFANATASAARSDAAPSHGAARRTRGRCGNLAANADQPPARSTAPSSFASCAPSSRSASMSMPLARNRSASMSPLSSSSSRRRAAPASVRPARSRTSWRAPLASLRGNQPVSGCCIATRTRRKFDFHTGTSSHATASSRPHDTATCAAVSPVSSSTRSTSALQTSTRYASVRTWPFMQAPFNGMARCQFLGSATSASPSPSLASVSATNLRNASMPSAPREPR